MADSKRFSYQSWGTGNTVDDIEQSAITRARAELGGYDGPLSLGTYSIMTADPQPRPGLLDRRSAEVNRQAYNGRQKLWAVIAVYGLRQPEIKTEEDDG